MARGVQPFFQGKTRTALKTEIRAFLDRFQLNEEFESPLLADLIAEKHYYCSRHGLRPVRFKKQFRAGGGYDFAAFFPERGWHLVSWAQCIHVRRDEDWIKRALRDTARPLVAKYKEQHPVCERCGQASTDEVDHVSPQFDDLAREAICSLSEADWAAIVDVFDWWSDQPFVLPAESPALLHFIAAHGLAKFQAVCKKCHLANARDRKRPKDVASGCFTSQHGIGEEQGHD
jgi:hypothetical protein